MRSSKVKRIPYAPGPLKSGAPQITEGDNSAKSIVDALVAKPSWVTKIQKLVSCTMKKCFTIAKNIFRLGAISPLIEAPNLFPDVPSFIMTSSDALFDIAAS